LERNVFKNSTNRSYISQLSYSAVTNVKRIWNESVIFVKWNAFLKERFWNGFVRICNAFFLQFQCKTNFRYRYSFTRRNVSVTDKSFQIVERILKSNKTEKPFRFVSLLEWIIWRWSLIVFHPSSILALPHLMSSLLKTRPRYYFEHLRPEPDPKWTLSSLKICFFVVTIPTNPKSCLLKKSIGIL
jgi:hypothetical protein